MTISCGLHANRGYGILLTDVGDKIVWVTDP